MKKVAYALIPALLAVSCGKECLAELPEQGGYANDCIPGHEMIVLGEKLEDPYTVQNMTRAFKSLYPTKAASEVISTTDYYVRFLPNGQEQFDQLLEAGVEMLDYPVDYSIVRDGDYYHDPTIPEGKITWQYGVVPPDFKFPMGVKYEILDECFISEHQVISRASQDIDWDAVEEESFRLTGNNLPDDGVRSGKRPVTRRTAAAPKGRIAILDEDYDSEPIGVAGVKVSANVFVRFASAYTDESGYYSMTTSFRNRPRYRLVFKNEKGFAIGFNLILVPASFSTLGRGEPEGLDAVISKASNRLLFCRCVVNNAGYDYFGMCDASKSDYISAPPTNLRIWIFKNMARSSAMMLQQGVLVDGSLVDEFMGGYTSLLKMFLPDLTIGLEGREDYASIYGEALHSLAHASHFMRVGKEYWNKYVKFLLTSFVTSGWMAYGVGTEKDAGYCEIAEMWAFYLQTRNYRDRYPSDAASFGTAHWFYPQIFMYMDERGIGKYKIFKALTDDVVNRTILQNKLLSMYPESKSVLTQAFDRYR